jgi:hypothetical protein
LDSGFPVSSGNHGYLLIIPDSPQDFVGNTDMIDLYGGEKGFTLGFHSVKTNVGWKPGPTVNTPLTKDLLSPVINQKADVAAVREYNDRWRYNANGNKDYYKKNWNYYSSIQIPPPKGMTDTQFIAKLLQLTASYRLNNVTTQQEYALWTTNCQAAVNSILSEAMVELSNMDRVHKSLEAGPGIRAGETERLDSKLFQSHAGAVPNSISMDVNSDYTLLSKRLGYTVYHVTLHYYADASNQARTITMMGGLREIEDQARRYALPSNIQGLFDVGMEKLRKSLKN